MRLLCAVLRDCAKREVVVVVEVELEGEGGEVDSERDNGVVVADVVEPTEEPDELPLSEGRGERFISLFLAWSSFQPMTRCGARLDALRD